MVSVKKKENVIGKFSSYKLKFQLMTKFSIITILSCIAISLLIVLFIQNNITDRTLKDSNAYVVSRVELEMHNVLTQMVTVFQSTLFNVGQLMVEMESAIKDVFLINTINQPGGVLYATYPTIPPTATIKSQMGGCSGTISSSLTTLLCPQNDYDYFATAGDVNKYNLPNFIELDNIIPYLMTPYLNEKIYRLVVQTYDIDSATPDSKRNICKFYPAIQIGEVEQSYYNINSKYYSDQRSYNTKYPSRVYIQGPYQVESTSDTPLKVMSLTRTFKVGDIHYHIRTELKISVIDDFVKSHEFRSKNEILILLKRGTFVYSTAYWKIKGPTSYIFDEDMKIYSGLDKEGFQSLITSQKQITVTKKNEQEETKEYLVTPILLQEGYDPNVIADYLQPGADKNEDNFFVILLYGEKDQMYEVSDKIKALTDKQKFITSTICLVTSFITLVIVYVATYLVSVSVDRPLRVLISILKKLNNAETIKQNTLIRIRDQLEYQASVSEYQVKELVVSFKSLIDTLIDRNQNNKNLVIKPKIDYPLNELETNFVKKTKGNQVEFDWEKYVKNLKNQSKFLESMNPIKNPNEISN